MTVNDYFSQRHKVRKVFLNFSESVFSYSSQHSLRLCENTNFSLTPLSIMVFKITNPSPSERKLSQSVIQVTEMLGMYHAELARILGHNVGT